MDRSNARTLPPAQVTIEAFVDATVSDATGARKIAVVMMRGRVDADGSWVLALHPAADPMQGDLMSGDDPEQAAMLLTICTKIASMEWGTA